MKKYFNITSITQNKLNHERTFEQFTVVSFLPA